MNTPASSSDPVRVPAEVLRGIRKAQESSVVNKYSVTEVTFAAQALEEEAARSWVVRHPTLYLQGVFNGFVEDIEIE
jgi:hypothetical protein